MPGGPGGSGGTEMEAGGSSAFSFTPGAYRFVDGSGYMGRVGEYDTLQQSAGADFSSTFVSTRNHVTVVSRANVLSGDDYSAGTQLTAGERLQVGLFVRSFMQQQDHYNFYAFPVLDVNPDGTVSRQHHRSHPRSVCVRGEKKAGQRVRAGQSAKAANPSVCEGGLAGARGRNAACLPG